MATKSNPFLPGGAVKPKQQPASTATEETKKNAAPPPPPPGAAAGSGPDTFEVDLTEVESGNIIPDGVYHVRCIEVEQSVSQAGNPMFIWTLTIVSGDHQGMDFKLFTAMSAAAMWKVAETVKALGVGDTGQVVKFKRSDVINKECGALIEVDTYKGQKRSQISRLMTMEEAAEMFEEG